ncbi:hypothetical protein O181_096972 [Austropuccinia psidii MF-1]|uniref:Uncharacterized protein n=1 Tax=Austropuccinia psidii MF-1 TaxID=1389203 RepID=A0A9Q3PE15_9BASI|nr:hypothetical protein [Austropuccinia psidii MF-1]
MPSTRSGASYNPSSSSQKDNRHDHGRSQPGTEGKGSVDDCQTTKIVQGAPDPCRSVDQLHELLPDCEKITGPSQYLQIAQWMESIDGEEKNDALDTRVEKNQPPTTQASLKNSSSGQQQQFQREKAAPSSKQGKRKGTIHQTLQPGLEDSKDSTGCHGKCVSEGQNNDGITKERGGQIKISEMISDIFDSIPELYEAITEIKSHFSDKNTSICGKLKTHNLSLSQINETLECFEKSLRTIKNSNNDNSFGNKINDQSPIIKELAEKNSKFNIDDMIETRIKQAEDTIKENNKKALGDISKSFTEVKTHIIALDKSFDTSKEEMSKLTIK